MNIDRKGRFDLSVVKSVDGDIPKRLAKGDVLFNNTNSPELIGKTTVIPIDDQLAYSNHMTRIRLEPGMNPSFVAKQLHFLWMSGYFRHRCKNHVNQASIAAEPLSRTVPLLVAPSTLQDRIADALDELLSDLDAGVAALERVRAKLGQYRAAVLKAAVSGELTAEWRQQHPAAEPATELLQRILAERRRRWEEAQLQKFQAAGKAPPKDWKAKYPQPVPPDTTNLPPLPAGWCWATIEQLSSEIRNGYGLKPNATEGVPILRISSVRPFALDLNDRRYLSGIASDYLVDQIRTGDLLFTRYNGSRNLVGVCAIVPNIDEQIVHPDKLIRARLLPLIAAPSFFAIAANIGASRRFVEQRIRTTAGQAGISGSDVRAVPVPFPPQTEQDVIVEMVEDQLSVIEHLNHDLEARLQSSTGLRQSILRHAFTGQLVPQDPSDEPASELLKRITAERANNASRKAAKAQRK